MVVHFARGRGGASAGAARGRALVLSAHLSGTAIEVGIAFVSATGKRRADIARQTAAHRHVVGHLAFGVLAARTGITLFFCGMKSMSQYILNDVSDRVVDYRHLLL